MRIEQSDVLEIHVFHSGECMVTIDVPNGAGTEYSMYASWDYGLEAHETVEHDDESWNDDDGLSDVEADAMTLESAGWGTDEDYGYYGEDY